MFCARNKSGNTLLEYAVIFGTVALALFVMNVYLKRGIQNRTKEMADKFISDTQTGQPAKDSHIDATSTAGGPNDFFNYRMTGSTGGSTRSEATGRATFHQDSHEWEEREPGIVSVFVPWQIGDFQELVRGDNPDPNSSEWMKALMNEDEQGNWLYNWQDETNPEILRTEKERLEAGAAELRSAADKLRNRAADLKNHASDVSELMQTAGNLESQADEMVRKAETLEQRVGILQVRIDELTSQAGG